MKASAMKTTTLPSLMLLRHMVSTPRRSLGTTLIYTPRSVPLSEGLFFPPQLFFEMYKPVCSCPHFLTWKPQMHSKHHRIKNSLHTSESVRGWGQTTAQVLVPRWAAWFPHSNQCLRALPPPECSADTAFGYTWTVSAAGHHCSAIDHTHCRAVGLNDL